MKNTFYTLLLTGVAIMPLTAHAENMVGQTTATQTVSQQNLTQPELNAIKQGALTHNGQPIPVETQIMMSTGNLDGYTIGRIQQSLADRGYYKGAITSKWDDNTATSTRAFQQASGDTIDESGALISSRTLSRLGLSMDNLTAGDGARVSGAPYPQTTSASSARVSANANTSYSPYNSPTVKSLGTVQMAANDDTPAGTYVGKAKVAAPGQTVPAPDNGSKSTLTRDAVASGKFNKTIDGSHAVGTTDPVPGVNGTTLPDATTTGVAGTRPTADANPGTATPNSNTSGSASNVVGNSNLRAGSTSSATIQTTGSLQSTSTPGNTGLSGNGTAANNVDGRVSAGSPATTSSAVGGRAAGSLSNSGTTAATGSGIAGSGGALSDGASTTSSGSSLSGSSGSRGSLSSGGGSSGGGGL